MQRIPVCLALLALIVAPSSSSAAEFPREGALERKPLFAPGTAKAWAPSESRIQESNARTRDDAFAWHWQVSVDHTGGEPRYPIGWPRISRSVPAGPDRDWSGWDFLRLWIFATTSRERLPGVPAGLGLHTPDRAGAYNRTLSELRKDEWVEIRIPLAQVPRHHDVRQIQFHIADANYRHGDQLDIYIGDLSLLRYAEPTLLELRAEQAVLFEDAQRIPVLIEVAGVKPGALAEVVCELRSQGSVVARSSASATRGRNRLLLEPGPGRLAAGSYELQARFARGGASAPASVRVVESPWR